MYATLLISLFYSFFFVKDFQKIKLSWLVEKLLHIPEVSVYCTSVFIQGKTKTHTYINSMHMDITTVNLY